MEHPRKEALLTKVKALYPLKEGQEELASFALDKVTDSVSAYCNIPAADLPAELDNGIIGMTVQEIDSCLWSANGADSGVQSITEGDVSVSFKSQAELYQALQDSNPITENYLNLLNSYRVLSYD
ncbi:hypothetical protein [Lactobacillus delbrueckii]|uniref:hypothetical protein n=1 Tax=Lactobacillus delbrueckii TaxID=1584 RepID=UPI003994E179